MEIQGHKMNLNDKSSRTTAQMIQEMKNMENVIKTLRKKLDDAISKQHEAMGHAVRLAKKNRHLEDELRDVDRLALAIDRECNAQVKENSEKVSATQDKLDASLHKIYHLEKKITELKEENRLYREKIEELQKTCVEIKKSSEKKLEQKDREILAMKSNEKEIMQKMERISEKLKNQRDRTIELEDNHQSKEYPEEERLDEAKHQSQRIRIRMRSRNSLQAPDEDFNDMDQSKSREKLGNRDNIGLAREEVEESSNQRRVWEGVGEKENNVRNNPKELHQDIFEGTTKRNGSRNGINSRSSPPVISYSIKKAMADLEHERDLAKTDVIRLQDEILSLRERLKIASEIQQEERNRYEQFLSQEEERVKKLEAECRNLHKSQGVLCGKVKGQEESISKLKEYLNTATKDLQQEDYVNRQLRAKNEEVERSLQEAQENTAKLQEELNICQQQMKEMEENQRRLRNGAVNNAQSTLARTDNEKREDQGLRNPESQSSSLKQSNEKQKENTASLEKLLKSKRTETLELKSSNTQLQLEVERLQNAVTGLQKSLESESDEVRYYQEKAQRLSDQLQSIQRIENNGRQQSGIVLENETESRSTSPMQTMVRVRARESQGSKSNENRNPNFRDDKVSVNKKSQGSRYPEIPRENAGARTELGKKSCSLIVGNRVYDFEVEDSALNRKGQSTYRLNNQNGQVPEREPNRQSTENGMMMNKTNNRRYRCASPKLHVQAGLPSGSEVSLEYEQQEEERDSNW